MSKKVNISFNISLRGILKTVGVFLGITVLVIGFMYFQKYEISELTTTIINYKLQEDKSQNIFLLNTKTTVFLEKSEIYLGNQSCFCDEVLYLQPDFALTSALQILNEKKEKICCQFEFFSDLNPPNPNIEIKDNLLDIYYTIGYNADNRPIRLAISE
ncbi:MAG: hypothetical protein JJE55_05585 [Flavobacteriaceae bacterium]|nr:hypothetical protein [Flavobacteriaceae bacterium]